MSLGMRLERQAFVPGDVVRGIVDVLAPIDTRELRVALQFVEGTADYTGVGRTAAHTTVHRGPVGAGARFPFEFRLPPDALPAFRTDRSGLYWRVAAQADRPGFDRHAHLPIDVSSPEMGGVVFRAADAEFANSLGEQFGALLGRTPQPRGAAPAGWYPDPWGQAGTRWWDGATWTGHTGAASP